MKNRNMMTVDGDFCGIDLSRGFYGLWLSALIGNRLLRTVRTVFVLEHR
jgi:hypothetical protein